MVIFDGKEYDIINRFDGYILNFESNNIVFVKTLPIADKKSRMSTYTVDYAKVELTYDDEFANFKIFGDPYSIFEVKIRIEFKDVIENAIDDIKNSPKEVELIII